MQTYKEIPNWFNPDSVLTITHEDTFIIEEWRDIFGYEGLYQVSSFGRVKSLERKVKWKSGFTTIKQKILSARPDSNGYYGISLSKYGKQKFSKIHQLVAITFLNHTPDGHKIVVDHKDNNKINNFAFNLQLITQRKNASKNRYGISEYTGVYFDKNNKWVAQIQINGKRKFLGRFNKEQEAANAYKEELLCLQ